MGMINRRNAVAGWTVWKLVRWRLRRKERELERRAAARRRRALAAFALAVGIGGAVYAGLRSGDDR
jgi:hypothetical protein